MTTPQPTPLAGGAPPRFVAPHATPRIPPEPGRIVAAACLVGLLAGAWVPFHEAGLALAVVGVAVLAIAGWRAEGAFRRGCLAAAGLLALAPVFRDADWVVTIALVGALTLGAVGLAAASSWREVAHAALHWPAGLVPASVSLLVATQHAANRRRIGALGPIGRGLLLAAPLVFVFGALFAAADATFSALVDDLADVDQLIPEGWQLRFALGLVVALLALMLRVVRSRAELARAGTERTAGGSGVETATASASATAGHPGASHGDGGIDAAAGQPLFSRVEWGIALAALVALFGLFVALQLRTLFGGDGYVQHETGLTYAQYAREGFGQLTVVAALTLAVLAVVAARGPIDDRAIRLLGAALCLLTLVIVASAWHRLSLYESAFGATRLRFSTHVALLWFAGTFAALLVSGAIRRGDRLPRVIVALTACLLLGFGAANPDRRIADRNADRLAATGDLDGDYVFTLSADAAPVIARLPREYRGCPLRNLQTADRSLAAFNTSRRTANGLAAADRWAKYCRDHGSAPRPRTR